MRWKLLLPIFCLGLLLVFWSKLPHESFAGEGQDETAPPAEEPAVAVSLVALRADPVPHRGRPVTFTLHLAEHVEHWNPYQTRFGPVDWIAFQAWADERFPWEAAVYADPAPFLFLRRGSADALLIERARPHDRFEVRAMVHEVFLGEPWIEVLAVTPLSERIPEGSILHVGRARAFQARGDWDTARQQYERARSAPLPAHALAELDRLIAECEAQAAAAAEKNR